MLIFIFNNNSMKKFLIIISISLFPLILLTNKCLAQESIETEGNPSEQIIDNDENNTILEEEIDNSLNQNFEIEEPEYLQGKIIEVIEEKEIDLYGDKQKYQKLKIFVMTGSLKGQEIIAENGTTSLANINLYKKGDKVAISYTKNLEGEDVFFISDYVRTDGLLILLIIFILISILVATKKGMFSLLSMIISFGIIFTFILPQIKDGKDPVLIAIIGSIIIIPVTFYFSHGFNKKTTISILGTFISLIVTGILSIIFVNISNLTGSYSEESSFLLTLGDVDYDLKGLLLAGIIIGTLGVLDDITVSQTAIVQQLYEIKKDISFKEAFTRSIQIGKDHIASMINTLILVYTGASLPLLLLFLDSNRSFAEIINYEMISTEIVRTLVGSIGLILAVPITTYIACLYARKKN